MGLYLIPNLSREGGFGVGIDETSDHYWVWGLDGSMWVVYA